MKIQLILNRVPLAALTLFCAAGLANAKPFSEGFSSESFLSTWYRVNATKQIADSNETGIKWDSKAGGVRFEKPGNLGVSLTSQPVEVGETAVATFTLEKEDMYTRFGVALSAVPKPEARPYDTSDRWIMIQLSNYQTTEASSAILSFNDSGTKKDSTVNTGLDMVPGNTYRFSLKRDSAEAFSYSITDTTSGKTLFEGIISKGVSNIGAATLYFQFWASYGLLLDAKVMAAEGAVSK